MLDVALEYEEVLRLGEDVVLRERIDIRLCGDNMAIELVFARSRG